MDWGSVLKKKLLNWACFENEANLVGFGKLNINGISWGLDTAASFSVDK